ncbi:dienelactone hydrolase family protein [Roseomonas sp. CCTCC AB2023176]|uniref:dienelactone hydrolase family protein n=1 Tax=Roseomonas sp. CCTCC AB2023176 TaxID=3342640 RepID=UPI0035DE7894
MRHAFRAPARLFPGALLLLAAPLLASLAASAEPVGVVAARVGPADGPSRLVYGLFNHPDDGRTRAPVVILVHDEGGPDGRVGALAAWLGEQGFATLELDLASPDDEALPVPANAGPAGRDLLDVLAAMAELEAVDQGRIALLGLGRGGRAALHALALSDLSTGPRPAAAVALYPGCRALAAEGFALAPGYGVPALILAAGADADDAAEACAALRGTAPDRIALHVLPGAHYAWDADEMAGPSGVTAVPIAGRGLVRVRADGWVADEARRRLRIFLRTVLTP